jgi:hypothetical protein
MHDDFDPIGVGRQHDQAVKVMRLASGGVVLLPAAIRRLKGEDLATVEALQHTASEIGRLQNALADGVAYSRERGLSWAVIGFSVGTSGEAARQRWGDHR